MTFVLTICGETTVSWLTTVTAACRSAHCRLGAWEVSLASLFFLFSYFSLAEQLKKDKVEIFPECCIVPCPARCAEEAGRENEKSCWTNLTLLSPNCSENRGSTETGASKQ